MDFQVSLMRLLVGDNKRIGHTYDDSTLRAAISFGGVRPTMPTIPVQPYPAQILLAGVRAAHVYPSDASGGPWTGSSF